MSQPYVGEIRMFAGNYAPAGWMFCEGQLLPISEYETLFQLIGTTYGGDGQTTFALPDLRGRIPIHPDSSNFQLGHSGGTETVTLTVAQMPAHGHTALAPASGSATSSPANNTWGTAASNSPYTDQAFNAQMNAQAIGNVGGSQPHDNFMPYVCVSFI